MRKKDELDVLVPEPSEVEDVHGNKIQVPKITWKKEVEALRILGRLLKHLETYLEGEQPKVAAVLQIALEKAPDELTRIAAILLEKEPTWVEQNLESDAIFKLIFPFVVNIYVKAKRNIPEPLRSLRLPLQR